MLTADDIEDDIEECADCGASTAVGTPDPHECAPSQLTADTDVESAFIDGRLYIVVNDECRLNPHLLFEERPAKWDERGRIVHVISKPAGGEIRGYIMIDGALHLRLPNYAGDWPDLDAAVARRLDARLAKAVR